MYEKPSQKSYQCYYIPLNADVHFCTTPTYVSFYIVLTLYHDKQHEQQVEQEEEVGLITNL